LFATDLTSSRRSTWEQVQALQHKVPPFVQNKPKTKKRKREKGKGEKRKTEKQQKTLGTQSEKGLELKL